jgi:hypothetical protein
MAEVPGCPGSRSRPRSGLALTFGPKGPPWYRVSACAELTEWSCDE